MALLIAVLGLVALVDLFLGAAGAKLNTFFGINIEWLLKGLLGYLFYPFTLILGVPPQDAGLISKIIAERAIVTEVVAYNDLAAAMSRQLLAHPRSAVIAAYVAVNF